MARRQRTDPPRYKDPAAEVAERVADLIPRLTLSQKLCQLSGCWASELHTNGVLDEPRAQRRLVDGIGHISRLGAESALRPTQSAELANAIQRLLMERSEHGIPAIIHEEAGAGYCARGATLFPQAIGQAATFDPPLIRQMATAIQEQMRAVGARQALAPVLDVARDPRWGCLEETFGEDPHLCGRMGVAFVRGLQGERLLAGVAATGKHFLGAGLPEAGRNHASVQLGERQLREVYAEPFAAVIREARLASIMTASNTVDGLPSSGAPAILNRLLREELKFEGVIVSDYYAVALLMRQHRVAADPAGAAVTALRAGVDIELPAQDCFGDPLLTRVNTRPDLESLIDVAVTRALTLKFELGLFDAPYVESASAGSHFDTREQRELACEVAQASIVLLENDGILPLTTDRTIALLGPAANDARLMLAASSYVAQVERTGARVEPDDGLADLATDSDAPGVVTPLQALAARASVDYVRGCRVMTEQDAEVAEITAAVSAARRSDVAVICVGGRSGLLANATSGAFRDATDLRLTGNQEALIDRVLATGTPTIVAVFGGRAFDLSHFSSRVSALLCCWLPGEEAGTAFARVLFGDVSPGGRLPLSLMRSAGQVPGYYGQRGGSAGVGSMRYTDCVNQPLYPFGHGLSYGRFEYGQLKGPAAVDTFGVIVVAVEVVNVGVHCASEVVQLYLCDQVAEVLRPAMALVGFAKLTLAPGQRARVQFHLDSSQAAYYNQAMEYVVEPGDIRLQVGSSSAQIHSELTVALAGEMRRLQQHQLVSTRAVVVLMSDE